MYFTVSTTMIMSHVTYSAVECHISVTVIEKHVHTPPTFSATSTKPSNPAKLFCMFYFRYDPLNLKSERDPGTGPYMLFRTP